MEIFYIIIGVVAVFWIGVGALSLMQIAQRLKEIQGQRWKQ